jgi:plasmid rolling circle replication initiator protein Rep
MLGGRSDAELYCGQTLSSPASAALEVTPGRNGTYHPHFHVLLIVPTKYFEPSSPLYISQAEWRVMWEQCLRADGRRIVDIRATENPGEVAKYVTKPGAYLKLDGDGTW